MKEKISVIVPVYNEQHRVGRCIESILEQSYQNIEIILVNDGSSDDSGKICDSYAQQDKRIKAIHKQNEGRVIARNTGLISSSGEWIAYVDSDDWIEKDTLLSMIQVATETSVDVVIAPKMVRDNTLGREYDEKNEGLWNRERILNQYWEIAPSMCSKLFRRELLLECQFKVEPTITFGEDMLCVRLCMLKAENVYVMDKIFYHYTLNHGQRKYDPNYIENIFNLGNVLRKHMQEELQEGDYKKLQIGIDKFVVRNVTKFGLGTVFGKSNPDPFRKKIKKIEKIVTSDKVLSIKLGDCLCEQLTSKETALWKELCRGHIIRLYFRVRVGNLMDKLNKKTKRML